MYKIGKEMNIILMNPEERLAAIASIAQRFKERAYRYEASGSFPFENFADLKAIGFPALTVPKDFGGAEISLEEMLLLQIEIAKQDGSTALAIGWHLGICLESAKSEHWHPDLYGEVMKEIVERGALMNHAATEMATGSPTHGGKPSTTAVKTEKGWEITGRKSFTTLSPVLDYFVVTATIQGTDRVAYFLVNRKLNGVSVIPTWDSIAMRGTGSNDLILDQVLVRDIDFIHDLIPGKTAREGWSLHIPATYYGIALGTFEDTLRLLNQQDQAQNAQEQSVHSFAISAAIGKAKLKLLEMKHFLFSVIRQWENADLAGRRAMQEDLSAVKVSIVNSAIEVVNGMISILGPKSLFRKSAFSRAFKDVRAGLHNPPMEDLVYRDFAKVALRPSKINSLARMSQACV